MVIIRFDNPADERRALGYLPGRFSYKSWANGDMMVSEDALAALAHERIPYQVKGPATYEHYAPTVRTPVAPAV
jgi:hypothetical protein